MAETMTHVTFALSIRHLDNKRLLEINLSYNKFQE